LSKVGNPQNPTVEDVSNNDDTDSDDKDFLEHGLDENELNELQNKADIKHFNAVLFHPQAKACRQNQMWEWRVHVM
jgi:hypothetical protein